MAPMRFVRPSFWLAFILLFGQANWAWPAEGRQTGWEKVVQAAKKEGQLVAYTSTSHPPIFLEFQKRYPEIRVVTVPGLGVDTIQRIMAERRAEKYIPDLLTVGATSGFVLYQAKVFDPIEPALLMPEVVDRSRWWQGRHHYSDPEGKYIFIFGAVSRVDVGYNTKLVNPNEIKSYWDLLDPKWKGKIVVFDPMSGGSGTPLRFLYYNPELGPRFLRRLLGEMDLTVSRDGRQIADWLAKGRYAISMLIAPGRMDLDVTQKQGLPVDWFGPKSFKEGAALTSGPSNVYLPNRAPHPNTARLALNWLLSREGQIIAQKIGSQTADGMDSMRIDIPKDDVPPDVRRTEGVKYIQTDRAEWMDMKPFRKVIAEASSPGRRP
jgi:ABC-type Fe3+ transport system substrate-binding protein